MQSLCVNNNCLQSHIFFIACSINSDFGSNPVLISILFQINPKLINYTHLKICR